MQDHPHWGWAPAVIISLSTNTNLRLLTIKSTDNIVFFFIFYILFFCYLTTDEGETCGS